MKLISTLASDRLCRDNSRFTPGALVNALQRSWENGVPSLISHDLSRPLGWTLPTAVYFSPSSCRLTGEIRVAKSNQEMSNLSEALNQFVAKRLEERKDDFQNLTTILGENLGGDPQLLINECVAVFDTDIAKRVAPGIFRELDDDGLIELAKLDPVGPGVYRHGPLVLFAHRELRRSAVPINSLNAPFLAALEQIPGILRPRVALDPDMVGLASTYRPVLEHQYWWGPEFDDDLTSIRSGIARHGSTEAERFFSGIEYTDFRWGKRDGERIFEVEEVRAVSTFGTEPGRFACRYAHSIVPVSGKLEHFDGAVRIYDDPTLAARREVDLAHAERAPAYLKLWRIDGNIPIATWKRLLSDYFRDNHLVGEYLGAPPGARFGPIPPATKREPDEKDPPASFRLARGSGIRAGLSFLLLPEPPARARMHIWPSKKLELAAC